MKPGVREQVAKELEKRMLIKGFLDEININIRHRFVVECSSRPDTNDFVASVVINGILSKDDITQLGQRIDELQSLVDVEFKRTLEAVGCEVSKMVKGFIDKKTLDKAVCFLKDESVFEGDLQSNITTSKPKRKRKLGRRKKKIEMKPRAKLHLQKFDT